MEKKLNNSNYAATEENRNSGDVVWEENVEVTMDKKQTNIELMGLAGQIWS